MANEITIYMDFELCNISNVIQFVKELNREYWTIHKNICLHALKVHQVHVQYARPTFVHFATHPQNPMMIV